METNSVFKTNQAFCDINEAKFHFLSYDNYFKSFLLDEPEKEISIDKAVKSLREFPYTILYGKSDADILRETESLPLEKDQFLATLYLLICNPELGEKLLMYELNHDTSYMFYVRTNQNIIVGVYVGYNVLCRWRLDTFEVYPSHIRSKNERLIYLCAGTD